MSGQQAVLRTTPAPPGPPTSLQTFLSELQVQDLCCAPDIPCLINLTRLEVGQLYCAPITDLPAKTGFVGSPGGAGMQHQVCLVLKRLLRKFWLWLSGLRT